MSRVRSQVSHDSPHLADVGHNRWRKTVKNPSASAKSKPANNAQAKTAHILTRSSSTSAIPVKAHAGVNGASPKTSDVHGGRNGASLVSANGEARRRFRNLALPGNTIVVIEERALIRDCFCAGLQMAYDQHTILAFSTFEEWLRANVDVSLCSVIIFSRLEGQLREMVGRSCTELLSLIETGIPVIVMCDAADGSGIEETLKHGARGYIPTSMAFKVAVEALRLVEAGGVFVPAECLIANSLGKRVQQNNALFTERQLSVIEALREGKANKQIAYDLNLRESTIKVHIRHIMRKLHARNRTEVAVRAGGLR